ncbi:MAG: hypothetical protein NT099_06905 [Candidatus Saganbacteria bacterium]|nr:hypothetical protein [Candidatus Saganbacteria bacterium]
MNKQEKLLKRINKYRASFEKYQASSRRRDGTMHPTKFSPLAKALEDYCRLNFLSGYLKGVDDIWQAFGLDI